MSEYKLSISMVPRALWGENLRKHLTRGNWNKLRAIQFARAPNCEFCGSNPIGAARHVHEEWVYDMDASMAHLVGLRTICRMCHFAQHPGFVRAMVAKGQFTPAIFDKIRRHFCNVNRCKQKDYRRHCEQAQFKYGDQARVAVWTINFGPYASLVGIGARPSSSITSRTPMQSHASLTTCLPISSCATGRL
jgi:hypothetical protein